MTDSSKLREALLQEAQHFHDRTPALREFAPWPNNLTLAVAEPHGFPALDLIRNWQGDSTFHCAIRRAVDIIDWRQTHSEAEVGRAFLEAYGYCELYGPQGLFHTTEGRAYIGFWGQGLFYPWHHHLAEEIYAVISGEACFEAAGEPAVTLGSGECRQHASHQDHVLRTSTSPVLTLILWRGEGLGGYPVIS